MTTTPHVPVVARRVGDSWGVFCLACSDTEGDYVYPCDHADEDYPPAVLVPASETTP